MNPQMTTPVTEETIARVKWYIDECLLLHFSKEETVTCLERNAGIDPELTSTLWDKEAVGKSLFFREYHNIRELISRLQDTSQFASRIQQRRLNPKLHKYHSDRKVFVANTIQQSTERPHAESSTSQQRAKRQHMDSAPPSMTQNVGHYGSRMGQMNPQFPATSSYGGPSVRPPHAQPLAPYGGPIQHPQVPVTTSSSYSLASTPGLASTTGTGHNTIGSVWGSSYPASAGPRHGINVWGSYPAFAGPRHDIVFVWGSSLASTPGLASTTGTGYSTIDSVWGSSYPASAGPRHGINGFVWGSFCPASTTGPSGIMGSIRGSIGPSVRPPMPPHVTESACNSDLSLGRH